VAVKDEKKVREILKDEQAAVYTDKSGKTLLMVAEGKAAELEKAGVVEISNESKTKRALEEIRTELEARADAKVVADKMLEKIVNGYAIPEELNRMVLVAVAAFGSVGEMEEYLGVEKGETDKEKIAQAAIRRIGNAIKLGQEGEINLEERDEEISLIRVVTDMLLGAAGDEKIRNKINEIKDEAGVRELQSLMPREVKVNRYVVAEAMAKAVVNVENNIIKEFEIDISKIKRELETREPKFNMFNKENEELMSMIAGGMRGQNAAALSPILRNARAVAAAA
jgi:hypothetical protein